MNFNYLYLRKNIYELKKYLKQNLNSHRYIHSLEVAKLALILASRHNRDPLEAYLCGLLHDLTKFWSYDKHRYYIEKYDAQKLSKHPNIYHQYSVVYFLWEGGFNNIECLRAIYSHSDGSDYHQLSKILFLADKLEPKRHYETATLRKLAFKNLDLAFELCKKEALGAIKNAQ